MSVQHMSRPSTVNIVEVGPRDGFQMEKAFIPTDTKVAIINAVVAAGVRKVEATSFVSPKVIPQMADAGEVMRRIERCPGVSYTALVPNGKGARLAVEAGVDGIRVVICASEAYNQRNVRMSIKESLHACEDTLAVGREKTVPVEAIIALAFGCPLEGPIPEERVLDLAHRLMAMGIRELSIADSVGLGNPAQVSRLARRLRDELPEVHFSLHIHNTRGLGLANVLAALDAGIDAFDSSIGGLGGCPVVPGGRGNIPTEDLAYMLNEMGIETGVDIEKIMVASRMAEDFLRRSLSSYVLAAGTREQVYRRVEQGKRPETTARHESGTTARK